MFEEQTDIQNQLQQLSSRTAHIEKMLGRGNKTVVMQFGSHSLKFGLANDMAPQWLRCLVAHKIISSEEQSSVPFEGEVDAKRVDEAAKHVEHFLTSKGNIKGGDQAGQKSGKQAKPGKAELSKDRIEFESRPQDLDKDYYVGEEVYYVEGRKEYRVRQPIKFGLLNIDEQYTEADAIKDLEIVVTRALSILDIDHSNLSTYSVVICAPDKFHRGQFKQVIDMLLDQVGFGFFAIHLESVLASFGCGLTLTCIVDIGYTTLTVTTVEEGIIVPNSQIKKHFGSLDIDVLSAKHPRVERGHLDRSRRWQARNQ